MKCFVYQLNDNSSDHYNYFDTQTPVWLWCTIPPAGQTMQRSSLRINNHTHIEYGHTYVHVNEAEYNYQVWFMLCNCCIISGLSISNLAGCCRNYRLIKSKGCFIYRLLFWIRLLHILKLFSLLYAERHHRAKQFARHHLKLSFFYKRR